MSHRHLSETGEYHFGEFRSTHGSDQQTGWLDELKTLLGIAVQCFVTTLLIMVVLLTVAMTLDKAALAEPATTEPAVETARPAAAFVASCRSIRECA